MINLNELDIKYDTFENIKHVDENGIEYWYARELMVVLNYDNWASFKIIETKDWKI